MIRLINFLFWLPAMIVGILSLLLPRKLFIAMYKPSHPLQRNAEQVAANVARLAAYKLKKAMGTQHFQ